METSTSITGKIHGMLQQNGLPAGCLPLTRLREVLAEVADFYRTGAMGREYVDPGLEELLALEIPVWAASAWVVAVPSSLYRYRFIAGGREAVIVLPAMYLYSRPMRLAEETLLAAHAAVQARAEWRWLPTRVLAAAAGMGEFGRNNMLYLPGYGSFPWLAGFLSSVDVPDSYQQPQRMERCATCGACLTACPGGALSEHRRLMQSGRCVNYAGEYPERCRDWFEMGMQKELLGCLTCQLVCPANQKYMKYEDGPTFSESETDDLISGRMSPALLEKLGGEDIEPYLGIMAKRIAYSLR